MRLYICVHINVTYIQGVLLPDRQTLRDDSRHEDIIKWEIMGRKRLL